MSAAGGRAKDVRSMTRDQICGDDNRYPPLLRERLGDQAPAELAVWGNTDLLIAGQTAFFCSAHSPGSVILAAYDQAAVWRDEGRCVVSGFHSPVEKECLRILLRGRQPVVVCPARGIEGMRVPLEWKDPLADGRMLVVSGFNAGDRRVTSALAVRRNELVAAIVDEVVFGAITPGGRLAELAGRVAKWGVAWRVLVEG